ncbi:MAG: citrate synthase, partial [Actinomycetota bacterium]|nr:citrate synthase [Actinomycetota bacterium]
MSTASTDFRPGLEGVIAFETEIAEPDREGGALRYRGVDIEELVGAKPYEKVWGLLVDQSFEPGMPPAERINLQEPSGRVMPDLQAGLAMLASKWGLRKLIDLDERQAR